MPNRTSYIRVLIQNGMGYFRNVFALIGKKRGNNTRQTGVLTGGISGLLQAYWTKIFRVCIRNLVKTAYYKHLKELFI